MSVQIWGIACATVIQMVGEAVGAVFLLVVPSERKEIGRREEKGFEVDGSTSLGSGGEEKSKKEL